MFTITKQTNVDDYAPLTPVETTAAVFVTPGSFATTVVGVVTVVRPADALLIGTAKPHRLTICKRNDTGETRK